jgi:hypothetical protein
MFCSKELSAVPSCLQLYRDSMLITTNINRFVNICCLLDRHGVSCRAAKCRFLHQRSRGLPSLSTLAPDRGFIEGVNNPQSGFTISLIVINCHGDHGGAIVKFERSIGKLKNVMVRALGSIAEFDGALTISAQKKQTFKHAI